MQAQTASETEPMELNYVTQTTARIEVPEGGSESEFWKMHNEYFTKVIAKSKLVVHYNSYRHSYGSMGRSMVLLIEFANWGDIMQFNSEERGMLEKAAWPDEAARKAFLSTYNGYMDPYHKDEIYVTSRTLRK
jgi:hypothetical protein